MRCATASRPTCSSAAPISRHPGAAGSRQARHDGALHPRRHRHDRRHREPARPAVAASQEAQEEQERPAAGVTARGHVPSSAGGRGYLPRPRSGVASRQCRSRQPRPDEGDVGHRALPHGGARRPCGALRGLRAHASSPTTAAATGIVRSARAPPPRNGSPRARPSCCRCRTSMWCSRCRPPSPTSPIRTRP